MGGIEVHLAGRWDDPAHIAWNVAAIAIWLAAVVFIAREPETTFEKAGRGKVFALLIALGLVGYYSGFVVPLGALLVALWLRWRRRELAEART